jgi:hypothetical protein
MKKISDVYDKSSMSVSNTQYKILPHLSQGDLKFEYDYSQPTYLIRLWRKLIRISETLNVFVACQRKLGRSDLGRFFGFDLVRLSWQADAGPDFLAGGRLLGRAEGGCSDLRERNSRLAIAGRVWLGDGRLDNFFKSLSKEYNTKYKFS